MGFVCMDWFWVVPQVKLVLERSAASMEGNLELLPPWYFKGREGITTWQVGHMHRPLGESGRQSAMFYERIEHFRHRSLGESGPFSSRFRGHLESTVSTVGDRVMSVPWRW